MDIDYIIVGQGICGTFLSYYLLKENKSVLVIDDNRSNSASRVASGVINPVTGRRIVKTWKIDELMPFASKAYGSISEKLEISNVIHETAIIDIHTSEQMQQAFEKRLQENEDGYLHYCENEKEWNRYFHFKYGIGLIRPACCVDIPTLLHKWRNYLTHSGYLLQDHIEENSLQLKANGVIYKNIVAKKIIFCDGVSSKANPYFKHLPFALNKGEALIVSIPGLPKGFIYKQGLSLVPCLNEDLFWAGSTYQWDFDNDLPTGDFKTRVGNQLKQYLKIPFTIQKHMAAIRPANTERRPFAGMHPLNPQIGILNGMGTKGCSLAPYYAYQLAQNLLYNHPIDEDADIQRFR